jgi:hypothetical protein
MLLVPPWRFRFDFDPVHKVVGGPYYPIFLGRPSVPTDAEFFEGYATAQWDAEVDLTRLLLQLGAAMLVAWVLLTRPTKPRE